MKNKIVDLRSDAVTSPTVKMREVMKNAKVGDDDFGEDPTVNQLEQTSANLMGKEAGLFLPSGTMGNLIAILVFTQRNNKVVVGSKAHIYDHEYPGILKMTGIQYLPITEKKTAFKEKDLIEVSQNRFFSTPPPVSLITLENSHNRTGGTVMTPQETSAIVKIAKKHRIPVHLDGARIFNAAVGLGVEAKELVRDVDSVVFSLTKAVGAPVGAVLVSTTKFIKKAREIRWMLGGGMKQVGVLAAPAIVGLKGKEERIVEDHKKAKVLAKGLSTVEWIDIDASSVQTNLVIIKTSQSKLNVEKFIRCLHVHGIKVSRSHNKIRFVIHKDISYEEIEYVLEIVRSCYSG